MMGLPEGRKKFPDRFSRFDTIPAVTDTQTDRHVAVANTRYMHIDASRLKITVAYFLTDVKMFAQKQDFILFRTV